MKLKGALWIIRLAAQSFDRKEILNERHYKSVNDKVDTMKVVAFNGSVRKNGNTTILIEKVFEELGKESIETELVHLVLKCSQWDLITRI